jgi:cytochrome c biogenesis protein CcdA/thiol-disulfide isomerase/thioredoxin
MGRKPNKTRNKKSDIKPKIKPENRPDEKPDNKVRNILLLLAAVIIVCVAIFGGQVLQSFRSASQPQTTSDRLTVYFFYGEECPHCHNVTPFINSLREKYPDVDFQILETWHNDINNKLLTLLNHKLGKETTGVPEVIIGNVSLLGENEIRSGLETEILAQKGNLTGSSRMGASPVIGSSAGANVTLSATYFYGNGCSHCENIKPLIAGIQARYPELRLEMLEINDNQTNRERLLAMNHLYGLNGGSIPSVFIGEYALVGETAVKDHFEEKILSEKQRIASCTNATPANLTPANPGCLLATPSLSPYMVVVAALVDSTNPCGLSVLVFLLITMAAAGGRRRILLLGGAYIAATFLFHLLVGIGLFSVFSLSGLSKVFSIIGGVVALLFGIINIADLLRNRETFFLSISESRKGLLGDYARMASLPAAFVLGILAGIFGFTCTGGIYISILGLMGRDMTVMTGLSWLVLYNLIFVFPLILITLLVAYGVSPERAEQLRTRHKRLLRVLISVILIALGAIILLGWIG